MVSLEMPQTPQSPPSVPKAGAGRPPARAVCLWVSVDTGDAEGVTVTEQELHGHVVGTEALEATATHFLKA